MKKRFNWRRRLIMRQPRRVFDPEHGFLAEDNKPSWAGWFYEDVHRRNRIRGAKRYWDGYWRKKFFG